MKTTATASEVYGVLYVNVVEGFDGECWLRSDGYATPSKTNVVGAWTGTREAAQRLIDLGVPLGPARVEKIPVAVMCERCGVQLDSDEARCGVLCAGCDRDEDDYRTEEFGR